MCVSVCTLQGLKFPARCGNPYSLGRYHVNVLPVNLVDLHQFADAFICKDRCRVW